MSGEKINDIERLILLYDKIDEMSYDASSDLSQLTYNTYKGTIPSWIWQSERADHYLQRIRFYSWYLESLFYLNRTSKQEFK